MHLTFAKFYTLFQGEGVQTLLYPSHKRQILLISETKVFDNNSAIVNHQLLVMKEHHPILVLKERSGKSLLKVMCRGQASPWKTINLMNPNREDKIMWINQIGISVDSLERYIKYTLQKITKTKMT